MRLMKPGVVLMILLVYFPASYSIEVISCLPVDEELVRCKEPVIPNIPGLQPGHVTLKYMVLSNGIVSDIEVLESSPEGMWDELAIEALHYWRYRPAEQPHPKIRKFFFNAN